MSIWINKSFSTLLSGLGFITSITFIFLVGVFMSSWLGASVLGLGEWFIKRMPLVRHIYNASKQISAAISPGFLSINFLFPLFCIGLNLMGMINISDFYRSEHPGIQRSGHHKASTHWWICFWVHHFLCSSPGLEWFLCCKTVITSRVTFVLWYLRFCSWLCVL